MARQGRRSNRDDEVYSAVMGKLVAEGVFEPMPPVPPSRAAVKVDDVIDVGQDEPRVLELLPALLVVRPAMFVKRSGLPAELAAAVGRLKAGRRPEACFGISGAALLRAFEKMAPPGKRGSKLKAFRLTQTDQERLAQLAVDFDLSETDVIRHALRVLAATSNVG